MIGDNEPMRRPLQTAFFILLLTAAGCVLSRGRGGVVAAPWMDLYPDVRVMEPPPLQLIPGLHVQYAKDLDFDLYLVGKKWYYPEKRTWYEAERIGGPWLEVQTIPDPILRIPQNYRKTW